MLSRCGMDGGSNHIGKIVTIAVTVQNAEGRQCTQITSGLKKASTLYAHTAAQKWTRNGYERTECERINYVFCCCNDYVGFKLENDIGIKTFVDNYKYCRSCGLRMLGVVEFRAK